MIWFVFLGAGYVAGFAALRSASDLHHYEVSIAVAHNFVNLFWLTNHVFFTLVSQTSSDRCISTTRRITIFADAKKYRGQKFPSTYKQSQHKLKRQQDILRTLARFRTHFPSENAHGCVTPGTPENPKTEHRSLRARVLPDVRIQGGRTLNMQLTVEGQNRYS